MSRRILIECTRTVHSGLYSGIQRFVRQVVRHGFALSMGGKGGWEIIPVIIENGTWVALGEFPEHPHEGLPTLVLGNRSYAIEPRPGDDLILIDSAWHVESQMALAQAAKRGTAITFICHDLLPLEHPEWFDPAVSPRFGEYLQLMFQFASRILCVSQTTLKSVNRVLAQYGITRFKPGVLYPGADVGVGQVALPSLDLNPTQAPVVLQVGVIEPRKGHVYTLNACEAVWAAGHALHLILVGKPGWKMQALLDRLQRHPYAGRYLHHLGNASDAQLADCYRRADLMVYPSAAEGFGLPIVEAAWYGLPAVVTDIPVFREIAGPDAHFVRNPAGELPALLFTLLEKRKIASPDNGREKHKHRCWREAARELLEIHLELPMPDLIHSGGIAPCQRTATILMT